MITSSINSWLGAPDRFLMATSTPSLSQPSYTSPNFPSPINCLSLKFFVARDNSSISKRLGSRNDNSTPTCLPTAGYHNRLWTDCSLHWACLFWKPQRNVYGVKVTLNRWIRGSCLRSSWNASFVREAEPYKEDNYPHQCHGSCSSSYYCCKMPWHLVWEALQLSCTV